MIIEMPDTWAWDEHDMLVTPREERAAKRAEIVKTQAESISDPDYLVALYTSDSVHLNDA